MSELVSRSNWAKIAKSEIGIPPTPNAEQFLNCSAMFGLRGGVDSKLAAGEPIGHLAG